MSTKAPSASDYIQRATELAGEFALDAARRDKLGGSAHDQLSRLKQKGLFDLLIPLQYGGAGQPWSVILKIVRVLAKADAAVAHLYGYHYMNLTGVYLRGTEAQKQFFLGETAAKQLFWANSFNPLDPSVIGVQQGNHFVVSGKKHFSSGSPDSDLLAFSWVDEKTGDFLEGIIPTSRKGVRVDNDWDSFGQRQTGSGTVFFDEVVLEKAEILERTTLTEHPIVTFDTVLSQAILAHVFMGVAEGCLDEAKQYTVTRTRPWHTSGVEKASLDPWVQRQYGEFWISTQAAAGLVNKAAEQIDKAWSLGFALSAEIRGECAVSVAAANVYAGQVSLDITNRVFEVMGARSTSLQYGYDRFWRNIRTHTLHNPAEYKLRNIGNWLLNDEYPKPGLYS